MVDPDRLQKFTELAVDAYNSETVLGEIFTRRDFDPERDEDHEFVQIGHRTTLPRKFFVEGGNYHNAQLAEDFARSVYLGERNYVLRACNDSPVPSTAMLDSFNYKELVEAIQLVDGATHIYLPLYFHETVHDWLDEDRLKFGAGVTYLHTNDSRVKVNWLPDETGFTNIFILDAARAEIIQKQFNDMSRMEQIEVIDEYQFNDPDDHLMLYYGEGDDEEFIFIIRTVISEPIVEEDSACVVDTSNTDIELDTDED